MEERAHSDLYDEQMHCRLNTVDEGSDDYEEGLMTSTPAGPKAIIEYLKNMTSEEWDKFGSQCAPNTVYGHIGTFLDPGVVYVIRQYREKNG